MASLVLILAVLGYTLTVARLTRLIAADKFFEWWRDLIVRRYGHESLFTYLWFCRACLSVWVAFATAPALVYAVNWSWWSILLLAPAASYTTILLATLEDSE